MSFSQYGYLAAKGADGQPRGCPTPLLALFSVLVYFANVPLTPAELKLIQDCADGKSYKEVANDLGTSEQQIKNTASALFREFSVVGKTHLVATCLRRGLID